MQRERERERERERDALETEKRLLSRIYVSCSTNQPSSQTKDLVPLACEDANQQKRITR